MITDSMGFFLRLPLRLQVILNSKMVFSKITIISVNQIYRDLKAHLHSKVMFSKIIISQSQPNIQKFPLLSNLYCVFKTVQNCFDTTFCGILTTKCRLYCMHTADSCRVLGLTVPAGFTGSHCLGLPGTAREFTTLSGTVSNCLQLSRIACNCLIPLQTTWDCLRLPDPAWHQPGPAFLAGSSLALPWSGLGLTQAAARSMEKPALAGCFVVRGDWHRYLFCPKSGEDVSALK